MSDLSTVSRERRRYHYDLPIKVRVLAAIKSKITPYLYGVSIQLMPSFA